MTPCYRFQLNCWSILTPQTQKSLMKFIVNHHKLYTSMPLIHIFTHTYCSKIEKCDINPSRRYVLIRAMIPSIGVATGASVRHEGWGKGNKGERQGERNTQLTHWAATLTPLLNTHMYVHVNRSGQSPGCVIYMNTITQTDNRTPQCKACDDIKTKVTKQQTTRWKCTFKKVTWWSRRPNTK